MNRLFATLAGAALFALAACSHATYTTIQLEPAKYPLQWVDIDNSNGAASVLNFELTSNTGWTPGKFWNLNVVLAGNGEYRWSTFLLDGFTGPVFKGTIDLPYAVGYSAFFMLNKYPQNWTGTLTTYTDADTVPAVPEPETYALMGVGLVGIMLANRMRRRTVAMPEQAAA
ncbi:hypothetical protein IGB42_04219 [Andreprevotia sp. IGB-42]|nr:hypothetical protein IGB42_04219 [Andreprevotia sp. IGB-42]